MRRIEQALYIHKPEDWYNVPLAHVKLVDGGPALHKQYLLFSFLFFFFSFFFFLYFFCALILLFSFSFHLFDVL